MALIPCPECDYQISDRAVSCPHCGFPLQSVTTNSPIVNAAIEESANISDGVTKPAIKRKNKSIATIAVICSLIVACVVGVVAYTVVKNLQEKAEIEALEQAKLDSRSEYIKNMKSFMDSLIIGGAAAEEVCNLTKAVWYDTIYEEYNATTAPYTQTDGKFHEDFNTSLVKLYASDGMQSAVDLIKENQLIVEDLYRNLLNPDSEFENCFEVIKELYSAYYNFTKLAITPSGSLTKYSDNFAKYDDAFIEHYDQLKLLIPKE